MMYFPQAQQPYVVTDPAAFFGFVPQPHAQAAAPLHQPAPFHTAASYMCFNPTQVQPPRILTGATAAPVAAQPASQPKIKRHNPYGSPVIGSSHSEESAFDSSMTSTVQSSVEYTTMMNASVDTPTEAFPPNARGARGQQQQHQHQQQQLQQAFVTPEELAMHRGTLADLARTAQGSSFIQAALREGSIHSAHNVAMIASELLPVADMLLLDSHGCYVVKSVMERLPAPQLHQFVSFIAADDNLLFSMCTHSLHTRRVVQYLMDSVDVCLIANVLIARCAEIAMTQQGCIIMQRAMDVTPEPLRAVLFGAIYAHFLEFAVDPFANYVVQHMLEMGDRETSSRAALTTFKGHVVHLSCNKFASNVMEKCLFHLNEETQHELLMEMYDVSEDELHAMLQDSFGNYMIQSSIALAPFKDVFFLNEKLRAVLQRTPYGHKIEQRLERRLKGRPVGTRSPQIGANSKSSRRPPRLLREGECESTQQPTEEPW